MAEALAFHPREIAALALLALLLLGGAAFAYVRAQPVGARPEIGPSVVASPSVQASVTPGRVTVHVAGAVRRPGVYSFDLGARVVDALRAAGGFAPKADRAAINLARPLTDGEQILVPRRARPGAAPSSTGGAAASDLININTASAAELEELPGVGEVIAQRIVDYRDQHGPFTSTEDLQKVSGIGPKTYEAIAPFVTV